MRNVVRFTIISITILCLISTIIFLNPIGSAQDINVNLGLDINSDINTEIGFYASTSDPSTIKEYRWDFDGDDTFDETVNITDEGTPEDAKMNHTFETEGVYNVIVEVVDENDNSDRDNITVTIIAPKVSIFSVDIAIPSTTINVGEKVEFSATLNSDSEIPNQERDFKWDFDGDGITDMTDETFSTSNTITYAYEESGNFNIKLTVGEATGSKSITVKGDNGGSLSGFSFNIYFFIPIIVIIVGILLFSLWRSGRLYLPERAEKPKKEKAEVKPIGQKGMVKSQEMPATEGEKPSTKKCPKCGGLILIPSTKRPLVVSCSVCGKEYTLKKKADKEKKTEPEAPKEKPTTKKCPQCGGVINIPTSKRPLKVHCSSCKKEYTLKKKATEEEITDIAVCPDCGKSIPVRGSQTKVKCDCGKIVKVED